MITFEQAFDLVSKHAKRLKAQSIEIESAIGRVLAENVRSDIEMPPFDKSAMDGYAVLASDIGEKKVELSLVGQVKAGDIYKARIKSGECISIMTGAPVPAGADAVVKIEDTQISKDSTVVTFSQKISFGKNICLKGEDIRKKQIVLKKGKLLGPADIAVLASVGKSKIKVYANPTIALVTTGDELVEKSIQPIGGQIRDSNRPMLLSYFRTLGCEVDDLGIATDTSKDLKRKITKGLKSDVLILTGGVSMGEYDLVPKVLAALGVRQIYHNVYMKPGKPQFFGRAGKTLVFGFPGNPVSSLLSAHVFVRTAIRQMAGEQEIELEILTGQLKKSFKKRKGRLAFYPVQIDYVKSNYLVTPFEYHGSADIRAMTEADGMMMLDGDKDKFKKGDFVQFIILRR